MQPVQRPDGLWQMRCSPDCPYEDCVILTEMPPLWEGESDGNPESSESSSESDSDSDASSSNQSEQQTEQESGHSNQAESEVSGESDRSPGKGSGQSEADREPADRGNPKPPQSQPGQKHKAPSRPPQAPKPVPQKVRPEYSPVFQMGGWGASRLEEEIPELTKTKEKYPVMTDRVFIERLRSIMTDNAYDRRVRGRKRGKLDMKSLHKVAAKRENVFTLKEARKNKKYNIMLVVDESGSMGGNRKSITAAECAVFLAKSFEGLNVNVGIIGFNQFITTRKEFTGPADYDDIYEKIATMNNNHGYSDNNDWDALNKAYHMFKKAPDGQNILIMLSDGQPANDTPTFVDVRGKKEKAPPGTKRLSMYEKEEKVHLHHLVKSNARTVNSIGIGIMSGGWQIPNHQVINHVNQLKPVIISELKKSIKRG